jgi:integrase
MPSKFDPRVLGHHVYIGIKLIADYRFHQVKAFLRQQCIEHRPKKSKVFTREDLEKFLDSALDEKYLLLKIVFIMGVAGGCRISELCKMSIDDVEDRGNVLVVQVPDIKTYKQRTFTVVNGNNSVHAIVVYHKCRKLRPENVTHKRLFLNYQRKKCTVQPVGLKMFSKMPEKIATFLSLSNPKEYTGHSLRRSSATLQSLTQVPICSYLTNMEDGVLVRLLKVMSKILSRIKSPYRNKFSVELKKKKHLKTSLSLQPQRIKQTQKKARIL